MQVHLENSHLNGLEDDVLYNYLSLKAVIRDGNPRIPIHGIRSRLHFESQIP